MKKQKMKSRAEYAITACAVIAVVALVNYVSGKFFYRLDLTENRQYTVSDATKRVLKGLDDIVTVKAFFSKDLPPEAHPIVSTVRDLLSEYKSIAGSKLRVTFEDPADDEKISDMATSLGVHKIPMQTIKRDKAETMMGYMGIGIMYAGKNEAIPIVRPQDLPNLEYDLTQAIIKVKRTAKPKIGVLKSQTSDFIPPEISGRMNMGDERTEKKFAPIFEAFTRDDYEVVAVDVSEGKPIDKEMRTLIVPNGDRFSDRALFEIDQYFMNGGNIIALANATEVTFQYGPQGAVKETKLLDLLEYYGVRVERNMIMDASCGQVQMPRNIGMFTINELLPYPYFMRITRSGFSESNPAVSSQSELMLGWASSLTLAPDTAGAHKVTAATLASSSEQSWEVTENFDLTPQPSYQIPSEEAMKPHAMIMHLNGAFKSYFDGKPVPPVKEANPDEGEDPISKINLSGEESDRAVTPSNSSGNLVVVGDVNFITSQNATGPNVTFMMNLVDWLSFDNNLIEVRSRTLKDRTINPNILEPGSAKPGVIRAINLLLMPIIVIAAGVAISLRRREKIAAAAGAGGAVSTQNATGRGNGNV